MKKNGFKLLQIGGYLILLSGITDFAMTFYSNSLPAPHLKYLQIGSEAASFELKNLDHAFLRAIGGCLIGIGIGTLTIIYNSLTEKAKWPLIGVLGMVTVGEGINASQIFMIRSQYLVFPLLCIIITRLGAALWLIGDRRERKLVLPPTNKASPGL